MTMKQQTKQTDERVAEIAKKTKHLRMAMTQIPAMPEEEPEDVLTDMRFVGVIFDNDEYKKGESRINEYLKEGYSVIRDFQTGSGIVITLGKFSKRGAN